MAELCAAHLARMGADVRWAGPADAPVVLAGFGRGGVVFSGHIDTVPATGKWKHAPGTVRGGRLYGRGSTDMKGGVAAILGAAAELAGRVPFGVVLTTDEEVGMRGAAGVLRSPLLRSAQAVVVAEPTALRVGLTEKGALSLRLVAPGKSGHASMPWTGTSATRALHALLGTLHRAFPSRDRDGITFNVGALSGGSRSNLIVDRAEALLDFRLPGAKSPLAHECRVKALLRATREPFRLERLHFLTALAQRESRRELQLFERVARRPRGIIYFATEAAIFARLGIPQVIFGPGRQEHAHVTDEYVPLKEVAEAARVYRDYALALGAGA